MDRLARQAVEVQAPLVRAEFDAALAQELNLVYNALDRAFAAESAQDKSLLTWPTAVQKQRATCLALFRKALNDILGALEDLRAGYPDLAQGSLRSALEGFAAAILINEDSSLLNPFYAGRLSVNKLLPRFTKSREYVSKAEGKQFMDVYDRLHKMTHPTALAMAVQFSPEQPGGFPIGGKFYPGRIGLYRAILGEIKSLTDNIAGYITVRLPTSRGPATNSSAR